MSKKYHKETDKHLRVVGTLIGFHGVKGEMKVLPLLNKPDFYNFKKVFVTDKNTNEFLIYEIESVREHKKNILLKLRGVKDKNAAELLCGDIYVGEDELNNLADNEYYFDDLRGLEVYDFKGRDIGEVIEVSDIGQARIFVKANPELACKHEIIVPFVDEYIMKVDLVAHQIIVKNIDELIELACLA